jgi:hypothetical protein
MARLWGQMRFCNRVIIFIRLATALCPWSDVCILHFTTVTS